MAARQTRDGTRGPRGATHDEGAKIAGKRAARDASMFLQDWRDEDERAGRMPAIRYMQRRYDLGYDPW